MGTMSGARSRSRHTTLLAIVPINNALTGQFVTRVATREARPRARNAPRRVADARCAAYAHNAAVRHFYHDLSNQSTRLSLSHGHMQLLR